MRSRPSRPNTGGLYGGSYEFDDGNTYTFSGSAERVLELYRDLVSPDVLPDDLVCREDIVTNDGTFLVRKGEYNPYNKWNTTHGIVHLCSPPNTLVAEIGLGADATVLRKDGRGLTLAEPDALICCAAFGGPDRNSDPTICADFIIAVGDNASMQSVGTANELEAGYAAYGYPRVRGVGVACVRHGVGCALAAGSAPSPSSVTAVFRW